MKPSDLNEVLKNFIKNHEPLLIKGAPGCAKTDSVKQVCDELDINCIISHPVISGPEDYKGMPWVDVKKKEAYFLPFNDLKELVNADKPTVFFLDDIGQAPPSVQAALMQLILNRRVNGHPVSEYVTFIAATNRREDNAAVSRMLDPLKSRFASIIEISVDADDWVKWAIKNDKPTEMISFIRWRTDLLHKIPEKQADLTNYPNPRTVNHACNIYNMNFNNQDILHQLLIGCVGEGFTGEFMAFLKMYKSLPNPTHVLMKPDEVEIPEEPSVMYALTGALASKSSPHNMENIVRFANRIPPEYSVKLMRDCMTKDENICSTNAFVMWAEEHHEYLI